MNRVCLAYERQGNNTRIVYVEKGERTRERGDEWKDNGRMNGRIMEG